MRALSRSFSEGCRLMSTIITSYSKYQLSLKLVKSVQSFVIIAFLYYGTPQALTHSES